MLPETSEEASPVTFNDEAKLTAAPSNERLEDTLPSNGEEEGVIKGGVTCEDRELKRNGKGVVVGWWS